MFAKKLVISAVHKPQHLSLLKQVYLYVAIQARISFAIRLQHLAIATGMPITVALNSSKHAKKVVIDAVKQRLLQQPQLLDCQLLHQRARIAKILVHFGPIFAIY